MRRSERLAGALAAALLAGCETSLPGGDLGAPATAAPEASAPPPVLPACRPFASVPGVTAVTGAMRSIPEADGGALVIVDDAVAGDAGVTALGLAVPAGEGVNDCLAGASLTARGRVSVFDPPSPTALSGVTSDAGASLYYVDPTSGGVGVATRDPASGAFRPAPALLWTADRPAFGAAAVASGGDVFAIGCLSARFLDADCYAARVPVGAVFDLAAYDYAVGGGRYSPRVDDAWPMTQGGTSVDLAFVAARGEWLLAYAPPLATKIEARTGVSPTGPWSAPFDVTACELADADMFCSGVHLHPALASPPGTLALSYAAATLSGDAAARRAAEPEKWAPRLLGMRVP